MRWYVNDSSLQGQFAEVKDFVQVVSGLIEARTRFAALRAALISTRTIANRQVDSHRTLREYVQGVEFRDLRSALLRWLDKTGPFIEDDRLDEADDYFECLGHDVTDAGLGEAARRQKANNPSAAYSFRGGATDFCITPLVVEHGIPDERLGTYKIPNVWTIDQLRQSVEASRGEPTSWQGIVETARERYRHLTLPDALFLNEELTKQPFERPIGDRVLALLGYLNEYMSGRNPDGSEGTRAREIIDLHFTGERAHFSGESETNQRKFARELTFRDPLQNNQALFAHWHGKISYRFFRIHFQWPVPADANTLKVVYIGPKITRD